MAVVDTRTRLRGLGVQARGVCVQWREEFGGATVPNYPGSFISLLESPGGLVTVSDAKAVRTRLRSVDRGGGPGPLAVKLESQQTRFTISTTRTTSSGSGH